MLLFCQFGDSALVRVRCCQGGYAAMSEQRYSPSKTPEWWDYTSFDLDNPDVAAAARVLTLKDLEELSRDGFRVNMYDTPEQFYLAEALEYIRPWLRSTPDNPVAICGPVGPVEQLPLVAAIINNLKLDVRDGYFAGMDELWENGQAIPYEHDLCFRRIDMEWCFNLIRPDPH